jgi:hypothetical protein
MSKNKQKQEKNAKIIDILVGKKFRCDHQWFLHSRNLERKTNEWQCLFCGEFGYTMGTLPTSDNDGKFKGEF